MKKLFLFMIIVSSLLFGQSWNTIVTTTLNEPNLSKMDLFTNKDGNHLLIKRYNGNIVYYNLNSSGVVNDSKTMTLETTGDFPNIVGSNDKIYALYKSGNLIKGKYSTNGGTNWATLPYNISTTANECNGVDATYEDILGVHLVWATRDNGSDFETYYQRLNPTNLQWVDYKQVTDYTGEVGGQPSVTFSTNRVHVSYNTNYFSSPITGSVKSRDKYYSSWQTPQNVVVGSEQSALERLVARGDSLFIVFSKFIDGVPIRFDLCTKKRSISGSTWSNTTVLEYSIFLEDFDAAKTSNSKIHAVYKPGGLLHKIYDGVFWSSSNQLSENYENTWSLGLSVSSNDVFASWLNSDTDYIRYRQYDEAPLTPPNFAGTSYNNHPKLTWNKIEPDIQYFEIYWQVVNDPKHPGAWNLLTTTSNTSFVDYGVLLGGTEVGDVNYKIRSKDYSDHYSSYTVIVTFAYSGLSKIIVSNELTEYKLFNNYPNPFNPSTKISYSIKEEGLVTLKVYDILGKEIATLVNENKPAGLYEAEFNASQLPSGMYIYKLQAGNFVSSKKMLLLK